MKSQDIELICWTFNSSFPEYLKFSLPHEIDEFIRIINSFSKHGWKIEIKLLNIV